MYLNSEKAHTLSTIALDNNEGLKKKKKLPLGTFLVVNL
jgi:hypothetical protein